MAYRISNPFGGRYFVQVSDFELIQEARKTVTAPSEGLRSNNREDILTTLSNTTNTVYYLSSVRGGVPGANSINRSIERPIDVKTSTVYREITDEEITKSLKVPVTSTTRKLLVKKYIQQQGVVNPGKKVLPESQLSLHPFVPQYTAYSPTCSPTPTDDGTDGVPIPNVIERLNRGFIEEKESSQEAIPMNGSTQRAGQIPRQYQPKTNPGCRQMQQPERNHVETQTKENKLGVQQPGATLGMEPSVTSKKSTSKTDVKSDTLKPKPSKTIISPKSIAPRSEMVSIATNLQSKPGEAEMVSADAENFPVNKFLTLSISGNHRSSDVCFIFPNGEVLYASRGYLAATCPLMEPLLFATEESFSVSIVTMTGTTHSIRCCKSDVVVSLKWRMHLTCGIPVDQQCLIYRGNEIHDYTSVELCGIVPSSEIHIVLKSAPTSGLRSVRLCGSGASASISVAVFRLESLQHVNQGNCSLRERPLSRAESLNVQQPEVDISHNIQHIVICEDVPVRAMESIIIFLYSHCGTITGDAVYIAVLAELFQITEYCEEAISVVRGTLSQQSLLLPLVLSFKNHTLRLQSVCLQFLKSPECEDLLPTVLRQVQEDEELVSLIQEALLLI